MCPFKRGEAGNDGQCYRCGFLAHRALPPWDPGSELAELNPGLRIRIKHRIPSPLPEGVDLTSRMREPEFGFVHLGGSAECFLDRPEGPGFAQWSEPPHVAEAKGLPRTAAWGGGEPVWRMLPPSEEHFPPLGEILGLAQTPVGQLARQLGCPDFVEHVPGVSPAAHAELNERRRQAQKGRVAQWVGIAISGLIGLAALIISLIQLA